MRFSLRSRFRGAFLGTALGQVFATVASQSPTERISLAETHQAEQDQKGSLTLHPAQVWRSNGQRNGATAPALGQASRLAIQITRSLIEPQQFSQASQSSSLFGVIERLAQPHSPIAFLPLMLFCHESQEQLTHSLSLWTRSSDLSPVQQAEVFVMAAIVSLMLQERFLPDRLIPLLLEGSHFPLVELNPGLADELRQVQSWLLEGVPLSMVTGIPLSPVAASIYSFLKMPASFSLALRQALRLRFDSETAALVGLLAGTHLSEAGLPITWRTALDYPREGRASHRHQSAMLKVLWEVESIAELLDLADRLWAAWSGAFHPQQWQPSPSTITAVPRLVRPR